MAGIALAPAQNAAPPAPAQQEQAPAAPQEVAIEIVDNNFTPNKITVPVGATVVWTQKGQKPHTVTADDGAFASGTLDGGSGASFKQTFTQAGTFPYFCEFHGGKGGEGMAAAIVVVDKSAAAQPATAPAPAAPAPAPAAGAAEVAVGDNTFEPKELSVPVGATVTFTNKGQRKHTVTADDGAFNSGTMDAGATFKQTFDKPGTFPYYCEFHGGPGGAGMAGVIKVGDGGGNSPPAQPAAQQPAAPAAPAEVSVAAKDFEFAPKEIRVKAGTKVTWKNEGAKPHTATADDSSFDTAIFQPGEAKSVTFDKPGTYAYYCSLHGAAGGSGMAGTVVVE
jgi:plastocyanin